MAVEPKIWKKPKDVETKHQETLVDIGQKLEQLRTNKKLSASGLSKELRISRNAYRQMERGEVYFSTYNLLKVLDYHSLDLTTFFITGIEDL